ncbi:hypothetical protein [Paenibacillus sp. YYML68]|uniref:hypothetical protein n=1 Tax=Paenibacillus sp. YYML68 TaxID=2909250 RepID=UPI0037C9F014
MDIHRGYRYIDLAYMPNGAKVGIEIQGFGPHARDLDVLRPAQRCCGWLSLSAQRDSHLAGFAQTGDDG